MIQPAYPRVKRLALILCSLLLFVSTSASALDDPVTPVLNAFEAESFSEARQYFALNNIAWGLTKKYYFEILLNPIKIFLVYIPRKPIAKALVKRIFMDMQIWRQSRVPRVVGTATRGRTAIVNIKMLHHTGHSFNVRFDMVKEEGCWKILRVGGRPPI